MMNKEIINNLKAWKESHGSSVGDWLQEQAKEGNFSVSDLSLMAERGDLPLELLMYLDSRQLIDFISEIVKLFDREKILVPFCGFGALTDSISSIDGIKQVDGVNASTYAVKIAKNLVSDKCKIIHADPFTSDSNTLTNQYDLIISLSALNQRLNDHGFDWPEHITAEQALLFLANKFLKRAGRAIFVVTPGFFTASSRKKTYKQLTHLELCIESAIHLPRGLLLGTAIDSYLIIIKKGAQERIFVGQYDSDLEQQNLLLENLRVQKNNANPALGRVCDFDSFKGFPQLFARERLGRLAKSLGWQARSAKQIFLKHELMAPGGKMKLEADKTSCFISLIGNPKAYADRQNIKKTRASRFAHIQLNPEYTTPRFFSEWFNSSEVGKETLKSISYGSAITNISLNNLLDAKYYLPSKSEQEKIMTASQRIYNIKLEADELEAELWSNSDSLNETCTKVEQINHGDSIKAWIEVLPFPMASILWRYYASNDKSKDGYEALLHFFEATMAFIATIHLSAFMSNKQIWSKYGPELRKQLEKHNLSIEKATIGTWRTIFEYLSSLCRKMLDDDSLDEAVSIYNVSNVDFLRTISDTRLLNIFKKANNIRNKTTGHGGFIGDQVASDTHSELLELIYELRRIFGISWKAHLLIRPKTAEYTDEIYYCSVLNLLGSRNAPFATELIESYRPLDKNRMYLFDKVGRTGLELLSFIQVRPSLDKHENTCYVFSQKIDEEKSIFVSYHYEKDDKAPVVVPSLNKDISKFYMEPDGF